MSKIIDNPADVKTGNNSELNFQNRIGKYTEHKKAAMQLGQTYMKTSLPMKEQIKEQLKFCGSMLLFAENPDSKNWELASAIFCRKRLCPLCSWRRSVQIFHNVHEIITHPDFTKHNPEFVMATLTIKNCKAEELPQTLDRLLGAWRMLTVNDRQIFRRSFLGTFRSLEITYNAKEETYHPHIHFLAAVEPGYFKKDNSDYISHERLKEIWSDALNRAPLITAENDVRLVQPESLSATKYLRQDVIESKKTSKEKYLPIDYDPWVHIGRIKKGTKKGVAEVAKYTVKPSEYINRVKVVETLDQCLRRRRLIAYGGIFQELQKKLKLEDEQIDEGFMQYKNPDWFYNDVVRKIMCKWTLQGCYKIEPR